MKRIIGVDEAGRGAWAGPLVVGAARLKNQNSDVLRKLKDSKLLSLLQREELYELIIKDFDVATGWAWPGEIDEQGLPMASAQATLRAVTQLTATPCAVIIDGTINYLKDTIFSEHAETLIKGDTKVIEIMAAAIAAKVERDRYMRKVAREVMGYGFEKHVGYGTKLHMESLLKLGISKLHRKSYRPVAALL